MTSPVIVRAEAIPVSLPLARPQLMGGSQRFTHSESLVVRLETDSGLVGWGEASAAPTMTGETLPGMKLVADRVLLPVLERAPLIERATIERRLDRAIPGNSAAKCALNVALYDLLGRHYKVPVHALLGGLARTWVPVMHLLANATIDEDLDEAVRKQAEGIRLFKVKAGVKPVVDEIAMLAELRARLGPAAMLCADANTGMGLQDACDYARAAASAGLLFFEQPLPDHDLEGMIKVAQAGGAPTCADESVHDIDHIIAWQRAGAISGVNLKTIKLGGIAGLMRAAIVSGQLGLKINLACKAGESSIGTAALVHLGYTVPNLDWGITPSSQYLAKDIVRAPLRPVDGSIPVPMGDGLGVDVDETAVEHFRIAV
ncbi:MAG: hypothetical protein ING90_13430 [Rhodocyclaceae bacterium]|nr:hypothetical protein [Rhodocyclaceae bacterium]MCA3076771.1 hypothetical protein [Rhodocyclaceae bacterium]MCA3089952.1 hypothetical protein [Rhodocyclaceae bacterium]MCA3093600.1 hypothetical protein [Rhodocyclaceae bacterium]MCA3101136.1 hypothetical protein [Rhodocyclaceae bacterium]